MDPDIQEGPRPESSGSNDHCMANGGAVVNLAKHADVVIVDHARKIDVQAGTHSWRYITESVKKGRLENLEEHQVGPSAPISRPVGSVITAPKGTRRRFTKEDDRLLWEWVKPAEAKGISVRGNDLYKQLAEQYPHHTWQSWRDHWLKYVSQNKWPFPVREASSDDEDPETAEPPKKRQKISETSHNWQSQDHGSSSRRSTAQDGQSSTIVDVLLNEAPAILAKLPKEEDLFWSLFAKKHPTFTAVKWKKFFHQQIAPKHHEQQAWNYPQSDEPDRHASDPNARVVNKASPHEQIGHQERSPSFQPESPTNAGARQPRARKFPRTNGLGMHTPERSSETSSESEASDSDDSEIPYSPRTKPFQRSEQDNLSHSLLRIAGSLKAQEDPTTPKRPKSSRDARFASPEIQSTPDPESQEQRSRPHSPLIEPELPMRQSHTSPNSVHRDASSPLNIRLFSDEKGSSPRSRRSNTKAPQMSGVHMISQLFDQAAADAASVGEGGEESDGETFETAPLNATEIYETPPDPSNVRLETQNLLNGHTQASLNDLDFAIPEPEEGWEAIEASPHTENDPPHPRAAPVHPAYTSPQSWLDHHLAANPSSSSSSSSPTSLLLLTALETVTTGTNHLPSDLALADEVFESLRSGTGIPADIPGVWTEEDDKVLLGSHALQMERVKEKHGERARDERWRVLGVKMEGEGEGETGGMKLMYE
ncbi:MAG: hypothetical protein Q9227_002312 [Pyrenula ochraceoflavens]